MEQFNSQGTAEKLLELSDLLVLILSEKERQQCGVAKACGCLWAYLADLRSSAGSSHVHYNLFYDPLKQHGPLLPPAAALAPTLWPQFHLHWACPTEAQTGELEAQYRDMAIKFSELNKAKELAAKKAKETMIAIESQTAELREEKQLRSKAVNVANRASKENSGYTLPTTRISARSTLPRLRSLLVCFLLQEFLRPHKQVRARRLFSRRKPSDTQVRYEGSGNACQRSYGFLVIGLADDVLVDEQDILAPAPPDTRLLRDTPWTSSRNLTVLARMGLEKAAKSHIAFNCGRGASPPEGRSTVGGRALSRDYAIDYMTCTTMFDELADLRLRYNIPGEILLKVPGKNDTPSRPPRGYVTLFLESFRHGLRCPLQPYFARILNGLNLAPGQLNPNGWRVLSGLFILWDKCCQSEPTVDVVKHLYQLKSSPKDAGWYYFQSSTKTRKPITDLPTGGGGNWKKKFFFAGGPWGQVAQVDGQDFRVPPRFVVPGCLLVLDVLSPLLFALYWFVSNQMFVCVAGSWGVHFPLQPDQLKRVEAVLANSCPSRELITVYNLLKSRLVLPGHKMEDAVIGALNRKRSRPQTTKRDHNKDAPSAKRANIVQQVSPLKTLPPAPAKEGKLVEQPRILLPLLLLSGLDLAYLTAEQNTWSPISMSYLNSCMTTYYKAKVGRYDRKMKEDIQSATTRANVAEKKAGELNVENLKLLEQESLAQAKAITLEEELTKVKEDLQRQKAMYEAQFESLRNSHRAQVENLEREADNQYNQGLRHSYRCIMAVLGKQHPDLKMDDLAAGVAQHMDEEAAKEDARFWLHSSYDQDICSINLTSIKISPRMLSSPRIPASIETSQSKPVVFPANTAGMALCFLQEIGLADDVLVDEQDIPAPAPPDTRLLRDTPVRRTLPSDICSSCLLSSTYFSQTEGNTTESPLKMSASKRVSDGSIQYDEKSDFSISVTVMDDVVSSNPIGRVCEALCPLL
ncbi:hypothetical protein KPL70_011414 [Citrus sinensis]|nr:hypothetical protein KPL70_011414 [Citrus sinensis]